MDIELALFIETEGCEGDDILELGDRAYKGLGVHRAASRFLCIDCLAKRFGCTRELIEEKIAYYKSIGCTLF